MSALVRTSGELISVTEISRNTKKIVSELEEGTRTRCILARASKAVAVIMNVDEYERMQEELDALRAAQSGASRMATIGNGSPLSASELQEAFRF